MPQTLLPLYGEGQNPISELLWYEKRGDQIYYFHGGLPVFTHFADDHASFRLITSQMVETNNCTQMEIVRAFGISSISMKRYVKKYREEGAAGFFRPQRVRGAGVLTPEVLARAQELLSSGQSPPQVARQMGLKADTVRKAIASGRLNRPEKKRGH